MSCKNKACDIEKCDGNCEGKERVALRNREYEICNEWRCRCGAVNTAPQCNNAGCGLSKEAGECAKYGVHFGAQRISNDISPSDNRKIQKVFASEPISLPAFLLWIPVPNAPAGYFFITIGGLGVSHQFCLKSLTSLFNIAGNPVTPIRWGVAGEDIACFDASWLHVRDDTTFGAPLPATTQQLQCDPCPDPPCAMTPAEGSESFFVQVAPANGPFLFGGELFITRCKWAEAKSNDIGPVAGRLETLPLARRVIPGHVPSYI